MLKILRVAFKILNSRQKLKIFLAVALQIVLSIFELLGILIFSILANLLLTGNLYTQNQFVKYFFEALSIESVAVISQIAILSGIVILLFIIRSFGSLFLLMRLNLFLVKKGSDVVCKVSKFIIKQKRDVIENKSKQAIQVILVRGTSSILNKTLGGGIALLADFALLTAISLALFVYEPIMSLLTVSIFLLSFFLINGMSKKFLLTQSQKEMESEINVRDRLNEVFLSYKDFFVNSEIDKVVEDIRGPFTRFSETSFRISFLAVINRYLYEAALLLNIALFGAIALYLYETRVALSVIATFVLAASRIVPAIMRMQQQLNVIQAGVPYALEMADLLLEEQQGSSFLDCDPTGSQLTRIISSHNFLDLKDLSLEIQGEMFLRDLNLRVERGDKLVIVGESGAGKTLLLDIMAGIKVPTKGVLGSSGYSLEDAKKFGLIKVGYVPQYVGLIKGTIRDNIILFRENINEADILDSIEFSSLAELILKLPMGLDSEIGDGGISISGGERQRIGLARALAGKPNLLLLDEFTSNLDLNTEREVISKIIEKLPNTTIVSVAHRMGAREGFERVIQLSKGRIVSDLIY
jgi:ABC-type bacteriocin/lantibiotic exporter with double-glycine peptidase domain